MEAAEACVPHLHPAQLPPPQPSLAAPTCHRADAAGDNIVEMLWNRVGVHLHMWVLLPMLVEMHFEVASRGKAVATHITYRVSPVWERRWICKGHCHYQILWRRSGTCASHRASPRGPITSHNPTLHLHSLASGALGKQQPRRPRAAPRHCAARSPVVPGNAR